jgi:hypothetical protein
LDPLIKSQLLYQLSYAPPEGAPYSNPLTACEALARPLAQPKGRDKGDLRTELPVHSLRAGETSAARPVQPAARRPVVSWTGASFPPAASAMTDRNSRRKDDPFSVR